MRPYARSSIVAVPLPAWRHPFAIPEPQCSIPSTTRAPIMPATKADIAELRGILRHLRSKEPTALVGRIALDALDRAVAYLEECIEPNSPLWWAAGALKSSYRKLPSGIYIVTDRDTATWALDQIFSLLPEVHDGEAH